MSTSRNRALGVTFAALLIVGTAGAGTPIQENSFSIVLPDGFAKFTKTVQKGEKVTTFVSKGANGDVVIVSHALMAPTEDLKAFLATERDSLLKSLNATKSSESEIEIDGKEGLTFQYSLQGARPMFGRTDLVVANPRMYQVIYLGGAPESLTSASTEELFSSFDLDEEAIAAAKARIEAAAAETPASTTTEAVKTAEKVTSEQ